MAHLREQRRKGTNGQPILSYYYAEFYDAHRQPNRKRISLKTRDRLAARQKLVQLEREYMAGLFDPWKDVIRNHNATVRHAVSAFLKDRSHGRAESTVAIYRHILEAFSDRLAPAFPLYGVEPRHIKAFTERSKPAAASRKTYRAHLRIFFRWCAHLQPDALRRAMQRCFGDDNIDPQVELHMLRAQRAAKTEECERLKGELGRLNKHLLTTTSSL